MLLPAPFGMSVCKQICRTKVECHGDMCKGSGAITSLEGVLRDYKNNHDMAMPSLSTHYMG